MVRCCRLTGPLCGVLLAAAALLKASTAAGTGQLTLHVVDKDTGQRVACRMHLKNSAGVPQRPTGMPFWHDHFVFPGTVALKLPRGNYTFELERGPEYANWTGYFTIVDHADDEKTIELRRGANLAQEGWWGGDLHIHRPLKDIELLMQAEDLHVAPVITWWNKKSEWTSGRFPEQNVVRFDGNRLYDVMAGEDERGGGALLLFRLQRPLDIAGAAREYPAALEYVLAARRQNPAAWIDAEKPFWWDMPVWLASGQIDSIGLANNHQNRDGMRTNEAWGKPRDRSRYPDPWGNGEWSQDIYYHVLNSGLRIPPSAGSASGVLPNPVGYNRVYVYLGDAPLDYDAWWTAFKQGRVVVTNGPLLRPFANGEPPGKVFDVPVGGTLEVEISLDITTRDKIQYLEVVQNGRTALSGRLEELLKRGRLPTLAIDRSGWFLVRAITDNEKTFRFASSGPWYVEVGGKPRISRASARFFLDWVNERLASLPLADPQQRQDVLPYHESARAFWQQRMDQATVD